LDNAQQPKPRFFISGLLSFDFFAPQLIDEQFLQPILRQARRVAPVIKLAGGQSKYLALLTNH
jgi:hypothetical protein